MIYLEGYGLIHLGVETPPAPTTYTLIWGLKRILKKKKKEQPSQLTRKKGRKMMSQCSLRL